MSALARTDTSLLGRWWWTVDRWTLAAIGLLIAIGALLVLAASPAVAARIDLDSYHFVKRQFVFLGLGAMIILGVSFLSPVGVRRLAVLGGIAALALTVLTLVAGTEIKGASRWLHLGGLSLQPSEFVKPTFAVAVAWLLSRNQLDEHFPGFLATTGLYVVVVGVLLLQPDVGMAFVVSAVWGTQMFVAGLSVLLVAGIATGFIGAAVGAYFIFDHVKGRIDRFVDPGAEEGYQVGRALDAFGNGGLTGRGPGEGRVKEILPDAHADFILAVAGEEFGLIACLVIVALFLFVVLRGINRAVQMDDLFRLFAATGLVVQFGLQAAVNMASTVNLIPPKGMTLPFISYGGSSTLALAIGIGMLLALTRQGPAVGGMR